MQKFHLLVLNDKFSGKIPLILISQIAFYFMKFMKSCILSPHKINYLVLNFNSMKMQPVKVLFLLIALFSLFMINANGQNPVKNYDTAWKKVEDLVKKAASQISINRSKKNIRAGQKRKTGCASYKITCLHGRSAAGEPGRQ